MKKKLLFLLSVVLVFSLASVALIALSERAEQKGENRYVVTSFYPIYILTKNLTEGIDGIQVKNLTENHAGCLHDYTLTTEDMRLLEQADLIVLNGGGMEGFLEELLHEQEEHWHIADASEGIALLEGVEHVHEGEECLETEEDHAHTHGAENAHLWMSLDEYRMQVDNVAQALGEFDSAHRAVYLENAAEYKERLAVAEEKREDLLLHTSGIEVIIFHDAFAYFAKMLGMEVIHSLPLDEDTALSAGELAEVIEEVKYHQIPYLFVEEAYAQAAELVAAETGAKVICLNPMTQGKDELTAYADAMLENLSVLEKALEKEPVLE